MLKRMLRWTSQRPNNNRKKWMLRHKRRRKQRNGLITAKLKWLKDSKKLWGTTKIPQRKKSINSKQRSIKCTWPNVKRSSVTILNRAAIPRNTSSCPMSWKRFSRPKWVWLRNGAPSSSCNRRPKSRKTFRRNSISLSASKKWVPRPKRPIKIITNWKSCNKNGRKSKPFLRRRLTNCGATINCMSNASTTN